MAGIYPTTRTRVGRDQPAGILVSTSRETSLHRQMRRSISAALVLRRNDVDDTVFWQQTLSVGDPEPGRPKVVWPGDKDDKTTKSTRGGLEPFAKSLNHLATGLNLTVRNVTTDTRDELTEQEAMERLAVYSFLASLLDECEIRTHKEQIP